MLNSLAGAFRKLFSRKHRAALEKHSQGAGENILRGRSGFEKEGPMNEKF